MISYNPLWKLLINKGVNKLALRDMIGCSNGTLAKMGKDEFVNLKVIDKICEVLDCRVEDVIEYRNH